MGSAGTTSTAGNDTFQAQVGVSGASSTFQATDVLNGGNGTDTFNITVQSGATGGTAAAQVNDYTIADASNLGGTIVVNYGTVTSTITLANNSTDEDYANALVAAIDNAAGANIATATTGGGGVDSTVTVTAPVAGTALPAITFGAIADTDTTPITAPTVTFTTPNASGINLATAVAAPTALVSGMEVVSVRNVGGAFTLDGINFPSVTEYKSDRSTGANTFNNIGTADVTITGDDVVTNGNVTFTSSGTASVTDNFVLNLVGGVNAGTVTSNSANDDWTTATVNSTGGTATATTNANVLTALAIGGGAHLQTLTINATSSVTTGAITGWDTTTAGVSNKGKIVVTGAAAVNIGALNAAVESVNASGNSGGVTLTASTQTDFQFVGSTANDRVTTGAVLTTSGSVAAGDGTADRLIVATNGHITTVSGARYSGFEQIQVADTVAVDMDDLSANNTIGTVRLTTGGQVDNMSATQAANVIVTAGGNSATLTVKDGTDLGQVDTVKITASDELAGVVTIALVTPVLTGVEKLELVATDNITIGSLTGATSLDGIKISGAGTVGITSGISLGNTNQLIDASTATGVQTIDISAATAAVRVLGGSAGDSITLGQNVAHAVNGGGGIDTIDISTSDLAIVQSDVVATANADLIVDFGSTNNDFDYNGTLSNGTGAGTAIAATEVASALTIAAALATADAANDIVFIATTNLAAGDKTAIDAAVAGGMTSAEAAAVVTALLATGGALNGAIAGLDTVLAASDAVLFQFDTGTHSVVLRITNTDLSGTNTLTSAEVALVGVFDTAILVAADYA